MTTTMITDLPKLITIIRSSKYQDCFNTKLWFINNKNNNNKRQQIIDSSS